MAISYEKWSETIDKFIEEEQSRAGEEYPVWRIFCQNEEDRSGGGLYNETVTIDTIGRYARALGDSNPLYSDPVYAAGSVRNGIVAPPLLECCICGTFVPGRMPKLRNVRVFDAGTKWERMREIRPGDTFSAKTVYLGVEELSRPNTRNRNLMRSHQITLTNQKGEAVSCLTVRVILQCIAPDAESLSDKEQDIGTHKTEGRPRYSREELEKVYASLDSQLEGKFRRGDRIRYWEDVTKGEEIAETIVGPYDESDAQSLMAAIGAANAFATKWGSIRKWRKRGIVDPQTGAYRLPLDRHISDSVARVQGSPRAIASGIHSQTLLARLISDWMGDAGFLTVLDCHCRKPLYFGDLSFQRGRVTGKCVTKDRGHLVKIELEAVRQDGVIHTTAEALVRLPSRTD